jgi:hypothetical protein
MGIRRALRMGMGVGFGVGVAKAGTAGAATGTMGMTGIRLEMFEELPSLVARSRFASSAFTWYPAPKGSGPLK